MDLSGYDFISNFSTSVLDQVAIDGGIYLLPVNYGMYGTFYNKTLLEEHGWEIPSNFAGLEALCRQIQAAGLIPGVIGTQLTGNAFSVVFNLAKTSWLTTPAGVAWERDFLAGNATAAGAWEGTMDYVQRLLDTGFFTTDPEDRNNPDLILDYLGNRNAEFFTAVMTANITELPGSGDRLGMMPYIGEDGSKNIYMYHQLPGDQQAPHRAGEREKAGGRHSDPLPSLLPRGAGRLYHGGTPLCPERVQQRHSAGGRLDLRRPAGPPGGPFPMTCAHWDGVLAGMGQAFTDWFRGENDMDGPRCIARMDELRQSHLTHSEELYFCRSAVDLLKRAAGENRPYHVVLLDWKMPVMNGYEATRAIRALNHPLARTIPIIAMTASAFSEDIREALEAGMSAHVAKPIDMAVPERTVKAVLEVPS